MSIAGLSEIKVVNREMSRDQALIRRRPTGRLQGRRLQARSAPRSAGDACPPWPTWSSLLRGRGRVNNRLGLEVGLGPALADLAEPA